MFMSKLACIERDGRRTHVVLPIAEWERLRERREDRADVAKEVTILADPTEYAIRSRHCANGVASRRWPWLRPPV
jgi:hypothetical protein